jgi:hypothetical protein
MDGQFPRRRLALRRSKRLGVVKRNGRYCIRYYDASGRQRWETIGPSRREAETVLHQRLYEIRSGRYPIIARRTRVTFAAFVEEWETKHLVRVRASTAKRYREILKHQLLPTFGDRLLSTITPTVVEAFVAEATQSGRLTPKTVNTTPSPCSSSCSQRRRTGAIWLRLPSGRCASYGSRGARCRSGRRPKSGGSS